MIRATKYGKVRGTVEDGVAVFRGIPYAAAPVGALRFRPPAPPQPWDGIREAVAFGPVAPQPAAAEGSGARVQSEDCLTLNVWAPSEPQELLPVLVHIHGGGFTAGTGADFDGSAFVRSGGIVCVSINYRLGALGFLYLGELLGADYRTSGNNGLLDQVAALRWVKDNIAAFGGDPKRVTIRGASAGAKCVSALLAVPAAAGLFHGAIAQSGATQAVRDAGTAAKLTLKLLDALGLRPEEAGKLLELPAEEIVRAQDRGLHTFGPVLDGETIPLPPLEAIRGGRGHPVPLLLGTNRDEAAHYPEAPESAEPNDAFLDHLFGLNRERVWSVYRDHCARLPARAAWVAALTDCLYRFATVRLAEAAAERGQPVWLYRFDFSGPVGAAHGMEGAFTDGTADAAAAPDWFAGGERLAERMHAAWIAFIRTGDPQTAALPAWPRFDPERRRMMVLGRECAAIQDEPLRTSGFPNQVIVR